MSYSIETDKKWQAKWAETELYKFNPDAEGKKLSFASARLVGLAVKLASAITLSSRCPTVIS